MVGRKSKHIVLIADADAQNIDALQKLLRFDYDIKTATDRDKTLEIARSPDAPSLILLNNLEPETDKYAVCMELKADKAAADIPIILLSDQPSEDKVEKGFASGVADYIERPFKAPVVKARVRTHIRLKRYRENVEKKVKSKVGELREEIQERRDAEYSYRALVEHARDGIAIIHDFVVEYANPSFCKMLGYTGDELIGAHLKKFISEEEFVKNTTRYSGRIKGLNLPRIYRSQIIHSDGSTFDVELNVSVVPYGKSLAALVFIRDMREEEDWQYCI